MAENDIYNSKGKYEHFVAHYEELALPPERRPKRRGKAKYWSKNKANLQYYLKLFDRFEATDISYVRRLRLLKTFNLIVHATVKDLKSCERKDIDKLMAFMHTRYKSPKSKRDFVRDIKYMWKILFPERDEKGRIDETLMPYPVRHLSAVVDKSKEKRRKDKLTLEEYEKLVAYFSSDPRIQAYLTLSLESLARPQELLYTKIGDYEFFDNFAKVWISEHGKEGTGLLQCIDSFPYVQKWYQMHPYKKNPNAFFFINQSDKNNTDQLKPNNINQKLRRACKNLGINRVTCYSLKRNGVTFRRLRGDSDVEIQHAARWTSSKQLKTYDMSDQEDTLKIQLAKRGLIKDPDNRYTQYLPKTKSCPYCNHVLGFSEPLCSNCLHIIDSELIKKKISADSSVHETLEHLKAEIEKLKKPAIIKNEPTNLSNEEIIEKSLGNTLK